MAQLDKIVLYVQERPNKFPESEAKGVGMIFRGALEISRLNRERDLVLFCYIYVLEPAIHR